MNPRDLSASVWNVIESHRTLTDEVSEGLRADIAKARHRIECEEWLTDTLNGLDDWRTMPWSLKRACGCEAHRHGIDGWEWKSCSVAMEGI